MPGGEYSLNSYGDMIMCEPRMGAFDRALRQSITPGCHVIDLGAGPGLFALLACKYGAGSVVAIEPDKSIEIGRRAAAANGFSDRITFVQDLSTAYQPERKADVVISDIRGVLPLHQHHIPTTVDIRERLLAPGGVQIPGVDRVYAALVEAPTTYARISLPWARNAYGVDLTAALPFAINSWVRQSLDLSSLLTEPQLFATLDYTTITEPTQKARLDWRTIRPGTAHGILMWFETELLPGIGFSNAPGAPEQVYGQAFFPLERPVLLAEGAEASAEISASYLHGDYVWNWALQATQADGTRVAFRQSSFKGEIIDKAALSVRAGSYVPPAPPELGVDAAALALFDGERTLTEIASALHSRFPDHFDSEAKALNLVAKLSARYNA